MEMKEHFSVLTSNNIIIVPILVLVTMTTNCKETDEKITNTDL